jgi:HAD superfamily hydrolase (TIGR01459 family)
MAISEIPFLTGISEIAERYDGYILDLWGVLHDGQAPFPGVIDCLTHLKAAGKRVVILSNAPRRAHLVEERVAEIGIPRTLYDHLLSSGEEVWQHLKKRDDAFYAALGRVCYHIGPPRDDNMLADLGLKRVESVAEAEFILNTGPWGWNETVENYEAVLQGGRERDLPMICANPDLVVMHRGSRVICAGALAQRYEEIGGRVRWHGKPFPSIYDTCFRLLGVADRQRILAIGDSLRTDIAGATAVRIASLLILGGIHGEELGVAPGVLPDPVRLAAAVSESGYRPAYAMAHLAW